MQRSPFWSNEISVADKFIQNNFSVHRNKTSNFVPGLESGTFTVSNACIGMSVSPLCACTAPMVAEEVRSLEVEVFVLSPEKHFNTHLT